MSKQVVVTDRDGNTYTYDGDNTFTDDGNLIVAKGDRSFAIHRDWAHAEVQDQPDDNALKAWDGDYASSPCRCASYERHLARGGIC